MINDKANNWELQELVDNGLSVKANLEAVIKAAKRPTNRISRVREPHIIKKNRGGQEYYTYCRGTDRELYLGDADRILQAVLDFNEKDTR